MGKELKDELIKEYARESLEWKAFADTHGIKSDIGSLDTIVRGLRGNSVSAEIERIMKSGIAAERR
jgi:hypothetical protein